MQPLTIIPVHGVPEVRPDVMAERFGLITTFILRAVADRARALERHRRPARPQLDDEAFVDNLVAMVAAALSAWAPS